MAQSKLPQKKLIMKNMQHGLGATIWFIPGLSTLLTQKSQTVSSTTQPLMKYGKIFMNDSPKAMHLASLKFTRHCLPPARTTLSLYILHKIKRVLR
jgi:hypothetical protein